MPSDEVPLVETERLRLRGHTAADFGSVTALWGNAAVTRFIGGRPQSREECWSRLLRYAGHWTLLGFGYWVVEEKSTGAFVGEVGFAEYKREVTPSLEGIPEMGWVIDPANQGRGYATEAVRGALQWGRERWGESGVACLIHPDHHASIRVAERCGFVSREAGTYKGNPTLILRRRL